MSPEGKQSPRLDEVLERARERVETSKRLRKESQELRERLEKSKQYALQIIRKMPRN